MELAVVEIGPMHFEQYGVWEYFDKPGTAEPMVRAVKALPTKNLANRVIAVRGLLACRTPVWLVLTGLDLNPIVSATTRDAYIYNQNGEKLKITNQGGDADAIYARIEHFIGKKLSDIFPITYHLGGLIDTEQAEGTVQLKEVSNHERSALANAQLAACRVSSKLKTD